MKIWYNQEYVAPEYGFDTTRKAEAIAVSLETDPIDGVSIVDPSAHCTMAIDGIERLHDPEYVEALCTGEPRHLAESNGFNWDPGIWDMAVNSTAGTLAATETAIEHNTVSGSLSSGLHHAGYDHGAGYCTVNGLAIAAHHALKLVSGTVLILDFDAHCGGGTYELIAGEPRIVQHDLSVSSVDSFKPVAPHSTRVLSACDDFLYADAFTAMLDVAAEVPDVSFVLYNAGMDPHGYCSAPVLAARERMVAQWLTERKLPAAFVLAGGYIGHSLTMDGLVALHRHTIAAFADVA